MIDLTLLQSRVTENISLHSVLNQSLVSAKEKLESLKAGVLRLEDIIELNTKAHMVLLTLIDRLNDSGLGALDVLLTDSLAQVFNARNYVVTHEVTEERGYNNLNFYLKETLPDGVIQVSNIRNATGGSIRAVLGLVCTVFYMMKTDSLRFLGMDEALSQVEDNVVDNLFNFLQSLCKDAGFSFLMVSHDQRFTPYFNSIYRIQRGGTVTQER